MLSNTQKERLERYKSRLNMYLEAEEAVLLNQEYTIGTKKLKTCRSWNYPGGY